MSLCEVHGRLFSGTAGSMMRRDSEGESEALSRSFRVPSILFSLRSGAVRHNNKLKGGDKTDNDDIKNDDCTEKF